MNKVYFSVNCTAFYNTELELPDSIDVDNMQEILKYIRNHLEECPVHELEWAKDLEPNKAVTIEDIKEVENENNIDLE